MERLTQHELRANEDIFRAQVELCRLLDLDAEQSRATLSGRARTSGTSVHDAALAVLADRSWSDAPPADLTPVPEKRHAGVLTSEPEGQSPRDRGRDPESCVLLSRRVR